MRIKLLAVAFAATVICRDALTYAHETTALKVVDIEKKDKVPQQQQKEKQQHLLLLQESGSYRDLQQQMVVMVKVVYQVKQQLSQLVADIPSVATTTNSLAVIVLTFFLLLMFFGGINYKEKVIASSTNSAVEGSVESVDEAISASDADLTSDGGAVQEEVDDDDDAMTGHGDSKTSRCVVYISYIIFDEVHY